MSRFQYIPNRVIDTDGIADGASIYIYQAGTSTLISLYTDAGFTIPTTNPYVVAAGAAVPSLYYNYAGNIRVRVVNATGGEVSDDDPYGAPVLSSELGAVTGADLVGFQQAGSETGERTVADKLSEFFTATDLDGLDADGTDQTAAFITAVDAEVTDTERKVIIVPPNFVWHPQQFFNDPDIRVKQRLNILDLGGMNASRTSGENTKIFGIFGSDADATEDTYWGSTSGHHPVLMLNNMGTAESDSAEHGLMSLLFARGYWTTGDEANKSFRGAAIAQYRRSVLDTTQWEFVLRSLAPWEALADGIQFERWIALTAYDVDDYVLTDGNYIYKCTVAGTSSSTYPTHTTGTAVDGTVTWQYIDSNDRLVFGVDQQGRLKTNGASTATDLAAFKQASTDTSASAVLRVSGTGASKSVYLIGEPTNAGSAIVSSPHFIWTTAGALEVRTGASVLAAQVETNGDVLLYGGKVGYGVGAGGTVTQGTSRTTGVTLDKQNGDITLFSAAGSASWQTFTVTNSKVSATDTIIVNQKSGTDKYMIHVTAVSAGSFALTFATTGGTTVEQPVFHFAVLKGSNT